MACRLISIEGMPEAEYVTALAELSKLHDIASAVHVKKIGKRFDANTRENTAVFKIRTEDCEVVQPPSRYIRKAKSRKSPTETQ